MQSFRGIATQHHNGYLTWNNFMNNAQVSFNEEL